MPGYDKTVCDDWYARAKEQTMDTLPEFLRELMEYQHDYSSIVEAYAAAAIATCWALDHSPHGGITGFQASGVMWRFVQQWMSWDMPLRILKYDDLLYPQMVYHFDKVLDADTWEWLQEQAKERLAQDRPMHPDVYHHMQSIAAGVPPCGFTVKDEA